MRFWDRDFALPLPPPREQLSTIAAPSSTSVKTRSFFDAVKAFAGTWAPETGYYKERSDMTPLLSDQAILTLLDQFAQIPAGHVIVLLGAYGGAIKDVVNNASAFPHRAGTSLCVH